MASFARIVTFIFLVLCLSHFEGIAQQELDVLRNNWLHYHDAPNALYQHLAGQAYVLLEKRSQAVAGFQSLNDWKSRQGFIRKSLMDMVGPFPEKNPLNAKIVRTVDKDIYRVEHIVFESQPGFYVTSSLFVPKSLKGKTKAPAVIYCSGHTVEGYRSKTYQHVILNLVKKGFVVFAFDPVGQGERLEYFDPKVNKSSVGGPTTEHSYPGAQAFITGSSQARYMIWDGIRAVDYLLTRKEIDPGRIGITGRSGGGTQSAYIAALDERIIAAAPECYITNFTRLIQSIGPQDAEQNFVGSISRGIDHPDLLLVRAPKPTLMITTTRDMFSIQGARETAKEVSGIFKAYGVESNFGMVEDDAPHESTLKNREALYAFFQKHLNNPGDSKDQPTEILLADEIQVTKTGQVSTSLGGETVFSLNAKETQKMYDHVLASRKDLSSHIPKVLKSAKTLAGFIEPKDVALPVFAGRFPKDGYSIEKYFLKGEGDYVLPYLLLVPQQPSGKGLIYLHPQGKASEAMPNGEMEWFVKNGITVLAPDMVGVGEMGSGAFHGDAYIDGKSHNIWYSSLLIGRSIVGVQAGDVVRIVKVLKQAHGINTIYGVARQEMSPVLLYAAAFDPSIERIALVQPYSSYRSIVMGRFYHSKFIYSTVSGSLQTFDLPDLLASLAPRKLMLAQMTDGLGKVADPDSIRDDIDFIASVYLSKGAQGQLNLVKEETQKPDRLFSEWIK